MKLNKDIFVQPQADKLRAAGWFIPAFDRARITANTLVRPEWVHFGAGNIFRAFVADIAQKLLESGRMDTGISVAAGAGSDLLKLVFHPHDELSAAVTLCPDGSIRKAVIGSVAESLMMEPGGADWRRLTEIFRAPSLKIASLTITEKGYNCFDGDGRLLPAVQLDVDNGPERPSSYLGCLASLCHERYKAGRLPIALVSMDNCSHNGSRLESALIAVADGWESRSLCEKGFAAYMRDKNRVSFPWSMIDKITPRPDAAIGRMLENDGLEDMQLSVTSHGSYVAPFVNAEEAGYLVIEDSFPNGRPPLEEAGVIMASRDEVDRAETMKVCTCLNPLHTALAVFGCLLGFERISEEMADEDLRKMTEILGYREGLPVVTDPGVIEPQAFIDEVINRRLPNPFLQDSPRRIATDSSQKIPVRFGNTIRKYLESAELRVTELRIIPLVIAAWCRYLMAVDDFGRPFEPSSDPRLAELSGYVSAVSLGESSDIRTALRPILSDASIMGVNLYKAGMAESVERLFGKMITEPGAVRRTLHETVSEC